MIKFPLNPDTRAELLDRKQAYVISVVIDPLQGTVHDFVLRDAGNQLWLVPLKYVIDADDELVRLRLTSEEFNNLQAFDVSQYLSGKDDENDFFKAGDSGKHEIYFIPDLGDLAAIPLEKDLALIRGAFVEASDGFIGTIEEIGIDPSSGAAVEIVIHTEGRDKHEYSLPISSIDRVQVDSVHLNMSKREFESLPSVPVKYTRSGKIRYNMLAVVFESESGAKEGYQDWKQVWSKQTTRFIHSAALLVQHVNGEYSFSETADIDKRHGRLFGAVTGGLVGLVGGPVGVVIGALAGAGVGGFTADKIDRGLSNHFLDTFAKNLNPGTSALIILIDSDGVPALETSLGHLGGILVREELTDEMLERHTEETVDE
jgi:uncharacterized membrane protein